MPERLNVPVRVIPRSRADSVSGTRAGRLVLRVTASPVDGAANRAAGALLAMALGVRRADVRLEQGSSSRDKTFSIPTYAKGGIALLMKRP